MSKLAIKATSKFKKDYKTAIKRGIKTMCKVMEDMRNEAAKEAARKNSIETAKSLLLLGKLTYAEIAQATKLTVDEVEELDKKKSA